MGRRSTEQQPAIRKSFLVTGGVAIGVAVLAFVGMNFLTSREPADDQASAISETVGSPAPTSAPDSAELKDAPGDDSQGLQPGGRDPFTPAVVQSSAEGAQVLGSTVENNAVVVTVFNVYGQAADVQVGEDIFEGARAGNSLASGVVMRGINDQCVSFDREGDAFTVCKGQRASH